MKHVLQALLRRFKPVKYGFFGDYKEWGDAATNSKGYSDPAILEKVRVSALKAKRGEAAFERDSIAFKDKQYSWPVLASLLWIASKEDSALNVLDFGGSLGSAYFQNIDFLKHLKELRWNIVEQKDFAETGRKDFEDARLRFYDSIENCLKETDPMLFLAGSSLQYIQDPRSFLKEVFSHGFKHIIIDRTPFWDKDDRITIQKIPSRIYDASYPAWIMNLTEIRELFRKSGYNLMAETDQGTMAYDGIPDAIKLKNLTFERCLE